MDNTIYTSYLNKVNETNIQRLSFTEVIEIIASEKYSSSIDIISKEPDKDERNKLKAELLPIFFPTLVLGSKNTLDDSSSPTGIVQFDVDLKDNLTLDIEAFRQEIIGLQETYYLFTSPSGGLKFGIKTDFHRHVNEDNDSLKDRFKSTYALAKEYLTKHISHTVTYDKNMIALKYSCYLSSDSNCYFNPNSELLKLDASCIYTPPFIRVGNNNSIISMEKLIQMLAYIPNTLSYGDRLPINLSVLAEFGSNALSILEQHWNTKDRTKLKKDLARQLNEVNSGIVKNNIGTFIKAARKNGWKPENKRSTNKIKSHVEKVHHVFPVLAEDTIIGDLYTKALNDTEHDAHLFRISTGAGKSEKLTDILSSLKRCNWYLLVCDTNQNIDEQVKKINDYFDKKTNPIDISNGSPSKKSGNKSLSNFDHSCATALKGKFTMCNRMNSNKDSDIAFKEKYIRSKYIPTKECNQCWEKEDGSCKYFNQLDWDFNGYAVPNIYLMHFNTLYNEVTELFKDVMPVTKDIKVYDDPDDPNNLNFKIVTKDCKPITAIIVDENAIQYNKDGVHQCIIPTDANYIKLTSHDLLIKAFNSAYKYTNLDLSVDQIKKLPLIYGDNLRDLLDESGFGFDAVQALKDYRFTLRKKRQNSDKPFSDVTDVYENVLHYLKTKDEKFLFGMRISNGQFIQGNVKKINDRFVNTKIIYLDATMNIDLVADAILTGKQVEKTAIDVKMSDAIKIHQLNGKTCSKSALGENDNVFHILNHAKQFIMNNGLQNASGGLISFQKLKINGIDDETFVDTAAKFLWGEDYVSTTSNQTRYFGNTRGYNGMKDCDYLVIIGDYNVPKHVIDSHHWNLYGEPANTVCKNVDHFNRMPKGLCAKTKKKQYNDARTQSIYEHFCIAELEQALGRGRLIYGSSKEILVYSSMPLGNNVVITDFIDAANVFPQQMIKQTDIELLKKIGFVEYKRSAILNATTDLTLDQWKVNQDTIIANILDAGFTIEVIEYIKSKKRKEESYLVFDANKFKDHKDRLH